MCEIIQQKLSELNLPIVSSTKIDGIEGYIIDVNSLTFFNKLLITVFNFGSTKGFYAKEITRNGKKRFLASGIESVCKIIDSIAFFTKAENKNIKKILLEGGDK